MTHLPFIAAAYALGIGFPGTLALLSLQRLRLAQRRLREIDPRFGEKRAAP